ncbi:MAG: Rieske 2Fe-2S domain-containing protein [Nitrospirae bacterium]|nr:Rieske 2Fe-2S domain-containing protein [Nitrospirota bacterium]
MDAVPAAAAVAKGGRDRGTEFIAVARTTDLDPGRARVIHLRGIEIALFNIDGAFYAVDNLCPHEGGPLAAGTVREKVLTCPWHRWQFHLETGRSPMNPAVEVRTYPVQIEDEQIKIGLVIDL